MPKSIDELNVWGMILAAGKGSRLADFIGGMPKQFFEWQGKPLFWHSATAFSRCAKIRGLIFVFPEDELALATERVRQLDYNHALGIPWKTVPGGNIRAESSRKGIQALPQDVNCVLIHDAARPFLKPRLIWRILDALRASADAAIPAVPVKDTIKLVAENGEIKNTLPRQELVAVQTPQGFRLSALRQAIAGSFDASITDDAMLLERNGFKVITVPGDEDNIKITSREDMKLLRGEAVMFPCCGFGYDVHQFGAGKPLRLGGVLIPCKLQVIAHSDGDVLLHALMDALLGLACLGDIGRHFPDNDSAFAGISSAILLDQVKSLVMEAGVKILQADLTVVSQTPKLSPYSAEICRNVANLLNLPLNRVNFKATTEEKLGFTGRNEGIKAYAIVSGMRSENGSGSQEG